MPTLRAAVIGVGHLGQHHARNYTEIPGVELVAVCDADPGAGEKIARKHKTQFVADAQKLIGAVDLVSIATPTVTHHVIAKTMLKAGIHCLVEKPMTATVEEAEELVELARAAGLVLQIGHIERFNPTMVAIRQYLNGPRYITADRVSPYPFRSTDVSVVMDVMIHDIDLVLALVGSDVKSLEAIGVPVISKTVDTANARLRFENGAMATITASRVSFKTERKMRIFQPDAYISLNFAEKEANIFKKGPKLLDGFDPATFKPSLVANLKAFLFGDLIKISKAKIDEKEPLRAELTSFVESVVSGKTPECTGEAGMKAIKIAAAIEKDINRNQLW